MIQAFYLDIVRIPKTQTVVSKPVIITVHLEAPTHFTQIYIFR